MTKITESLHKHAELVYENFKTLNDSHPEIYLAAEMINGVFDKLFTEDLRLSKNVMWQNATQLMFFGVYESWVNAYILTAAGLNDVGLMGLRRAVEFVCYMSKIYKSDSRANLWIKQTTDEEARGKFSGVFRIPEAYQNKKYDHLREALTIYELSSHYASHANFAMISRKWDTRKEVKTLRVSFQDMPDAVPRSLGVVLLIGYRLLESILYRLKSYIEKTNELNDLFASLSDGVRKARLSLANEELEGEVLKEALDAIDEDHPTSYEF